MGDSGRGRPRGRAFRGRRLVPYSCRARRPRGARISSYHSPGDVEEASSDDSTQPPSHPWEPPCAANTLVAEPDSVTLPIIRPEPDRVQIGTFINSVYFIRPAQNKHILILKYIWLFHHMVTRYYCYLCHTGVNAPTEPNRVTSPTIEAEHARVQTSIVHNQAYFFHILNIHIMVVTIGMLG